MGKSHDPLFEETKRKHPMIGFLVLLLALILTVVAVLNVINNSRVNLDKVSVTVPTLPTALESFRILHISDLHGLYFGQRQEQLKAALASARYDIVVVTGDVTGKDGDAGAFLSLIDLIGDSAPLYFIIGDEDPAAILAKPHDTQGPKAAYILKAESHGAVYLDAPVRITKGKGTLWLCPEWVYTLDYDAADAAYQARMKELRGQEATPERDAALAAVEYQADQLERIRQARRETLETDVHIAVTHHPLQENALKSLRDWTGSENDSYVRAISLVLAGHYVGGQWRIPGIGAVRVPASSGLGNNGWFPEDQKAVGLSTVMGIPQYISPGLGVSAAIGLPAIRIFNTPAVTVITLTSKLTQ
ncbi:MAG: metallophosphoesterase [Clostridia bacterium]|nr:metallophosphoesterase [Clostridia bacterium]